MKIRDHRLRTSAEIATTLAAEISNGHTTERRIQNNSSADLWGSPVKPGTIQKNGSIPTPELTDLKKITPMQRKEAVSACEVLNANLGVFHGFCENVPRYALGRGLSPTGNSIDSEHSKAATQYFLKVTGRKTFDAREEHNFVGLQKMALSNMLCVGDLGIGKVRDDAFNPRLQMFPSQAIDNLHSGFGNRQRSNNGFKEGIRRAGNGGRALEYSILKDAGSFGGPRTVETFDAADFMHVGRFNIIGQNRPLPWMLHGINAGVHILDITQLKMAAAKVNAYFAGWIETNDGSVPDSIADTVLERLAKEQAAAAGGSADSSKDKDDSMRSYANFMGSAGLPVFEKGEKLNFFKGDFDAMTLTEFMNWLIMDMSVGFGLDGSFIWQIISQSGPMARLTLQKADWFFDDLVQIMVSRMCQDTWDGVIEDGIARGFVPVPKAGADYRDCAWQGPGSMTIDKGRDGKLFRDLVNSGMEARSLWHEMNGRNGGQARKAIIAELIEDIKECQEQAAAQNIPDLWPVIVRMYFGNDKAFASAMDSSAGHAAQNQNDPQALAEAVLEAMEFQREESQAAA